MSSLAMSSLAMSSLAGVTRFCIAVSSFVGVLGTSRQADAQYYPFGPRGGVSIQSPFFSLNVPSPPYYYDHGRYGLGLYGHGYFGPSVAFPPIPSIHYYEYHAPFPPSFGYSYQQHGYPDAPGISRFRYGGSAIPLGRDHDFSLRYNVPTDDPYAYRGNVIGANDLPETYSVGRAPLDPNQLSDELRIAAERLRQSLANRPDDSDIWLEYLDPDAVIDSLDVTTQADAALQPRLTELADRYDGVADNPELRGVSMTPGFDQTRQLLRLWVQRQSGDDVTSVAPSPQLLAEPDANIVEPSEAMPTPQPDPAADATASPQPKTRRSL